MINRAPSCFNRRQFLNRASSAAGVVAAPWLVPSFALGKNGAVAPSERIGLGFIGVGMMGRGHLRTCLGYPQAQVLAACDPDNWRREDAKATVEKAYSANRATAGYRGCDTYNDLRELLARDDIDAVVIATGDNWHGLATTMAAEAGKDIYCEKPASKTIHEARAMIDTVRRYGRVFQTGLQQRSTPEFRKASQLVLEGAIGKIKIVYIAFPGVSGEVSLPIEPVPEGLDWNQWLGPAPWRPFNRRYHIYGKPPRVIPWHFCSDFGGGNLTSNAVHSVDVVQWALGMDESGPLEVIPPETGEVPSLTYKYPDDILLQVVNWHLEPDKHHVPPGWGVKTRLQNFGALYVGEEGWIHVGRQGFLESHPANIIQRPEREGDPWNPVANHHQNWLDCIKNREDPACHAAIGCGSTIVSHLGCIAHWTGRALKWDPAKEEFIGDNEANRLRRRAIRPPWRI